MLGHLFKRGQVDQVKMFIDSRKLPRLRAHVCVVTRVKVKPSSVRPFMIKATAGSELQIVFLFF